MVAGVKGVYYYPGSSRSAYAVAGVDGEGRGLRIDAEGEGGALSLVYAGRDFTVEPPLGTLNRVLHLTGDGRFESADLEGFAALESALVPPSAWRLVAWMENHWRGVAASVGLLAFFVYLFLEHGVPALARSVAEQMPRSWLEKLTESGYDTMVSVGQLGVSNLPEKRRREVVAVFERALELSGVDRERFSYELRLHDGGAGLGANAFAFPSGMIVATDQFVELCETDEQILAVFLHEVGHVVEQHGVRSIIQKGGVFLLVSLMVGDAGSVLTLFEGLPALLLDSRYSQRFELEADHFAASTLEERGVGAKPMIEALALLHRGSPDMTYLQLISTHPGFKERAEAIEAVRNADGIEVGVE